MSLVLGSERPSPRASKTIFEPAKRGLGRRSSRAARRSARRPASGQLESWCSPRPRRCRRWAAGRRRSGGCGRRSDHASDDGPASKRASSSKIATAGELAAVASATADLVLADEARPTPRSGCTTDPRSRPRPAPGGVVGIRGGVEQRSGRASGLAVFGPRRSRARSRPGRSRRGPAAMRCRASRAWRLGTARTA